MCSCVRSGGIVSRLPGVCEALGWVREFDGVTRDFAERERRRDEVCRAALMQARVAFRQAGVSQAERLEDRLAAAGRDVQRERAAAERRHMARAERIARAGVASRQQRAERVEAEEGARKQRLMSWKEELEANHPADLARIDAAYNAVLADLANRYARLSALTESTGRCFRGHRDLLARTLQPAEVAAPDLALPVDRLMARLDECLQRVGDSLERVRGDARLRLLGTWRPGVIAGVILAIHGTAAVGLLVAGPPASSLLIPGLSALTLCILTVALHFVGKHRLAPAARGIASDMAAAAKLHDVCGEKAAMQRHVDRERVDREYADLHERIDREWRATTEKADSWRLLGPTAVKEKTDRARARNERMLQDCLRRIAGGQPRRLAAIRSDAAREETELTAAHEVEIAEIESSLRRDLEVLAAEREAALKRVREAAAGAVAVVKECFPEWSAGDWERWIPPAAFVHAAPFGTLRIADLAVPLLLTFPDQGSVLFETRGPARDRVAAVMNNIVMRLLTSTPPGKVAFTIIDPVDLGQNFAGIMHLADYEETLVNGRIWTQPAQIEKQLADITEHMEKVIQTYLRNEYKTITEYNDQAGEIAEKYRFLVVSDFPAGFSDIAIDRLVGIAASGGRCGVYTIVHWDQRQRVSREAVLEDLRGRSVRLGLVDGAFHLEGAPAAGTEIVLDAPPDAETASRLLHGVGRASIDSTRVEVPFSHVAPADGERWSRETTSELKVAIGRTGATKLQMLALGQDTRQHALIVGKTGSGKSTLFHVLITNLALWCRPDQVEFYLVDFKKGVEFKCYASHRLPHARVVAIESDREFGLSVLQRVDDELRRRGEWFRELGVQDVRGYKKAGGREPIPRTLLIVDEFQEFFVEDDFISQQAALLLDRLVRQGRAFGVHVLLGSQTLGGAYTLARTTLGQMVVRIALQCNEADAYMIMDEGNPAPRLLTRPGEAIYNDAAGMLEGNSPFQIVWLSDDERDQRLEEVRRMAEGGAWSRMAPVVFEGNAPASIEENLPLRSMLDAPSPRPGSSARVWMGSPNAIKGPTEAVFSRQGGSHLLVVGQREETALTLLSVALLTLSAQHARDSVRFVLFDGTAPDTPQRSFLDTVASAVPHGVERARNATLDAVLGDLHGELDRREALDDSSAAPSIFVLVDGLQRFKKLRFEEDFSFAGDGDASGPPPGEQWDRLVREGPQHGIHILATCDSSASVTRFLSRKALAAFGMRVLFQMGANDSAGLIDSTAASGLGLHRALFHDEHEGRLETFRPYARPDSDWLARTAADLQRLHAAARQPPEETTNGH